LAVWLLSSALEIPGYGNGLFWALVFILFGISGVELVVFGQRAGNTD